MSFACPLSALLVTPSPCFIVSLYLSLSTFISLPLGLPHFFSHYPITGKCSLLGQSESVRPIHENTHDIHRDKRKRERERHTCTHTYTARVKQKSRRRDSEKETERERERSRGREEKHAKEKKESERERKKEERIGKERSEGEEARKEETQREMHDTRIHNHAQTKRVSLLLC